MHKEARNNPNNDDTGLIGKILDQAGRITDVDKRLKVPTHPFYDSANFPDEATYGQIVVDKDDPSSLWVYGKDDQWHKVGGLEFAVADSGSVDAVPGSTVGVPFNEVFTNAPNTFKIDEWHFGGGGGAEMAGKTGLGIRTPGLYVLVFGYSMFFNYVGDPNDVQLHVANIGRTFELQSPSSGSYNGFGYFLPGGSAQVHVNIGFVTVFAIDDTNIQTAPVAAIASYTGPAAKGIDAQVLAIKLTSNTFNFWA
jgi:hypothetical protein